MLQLNLSEAEIQQLNYERFHYPCPIVQKRIHAVYFKATLGVSNDKISKMACLSRNKVSEWIHTYKAEGLKGLCEYNYGTNKSELEEHTSDLLKSFTERPPMSINEAKSRIEDITGIKRSPTQVRAFIKRHGFRYIKTGHLPAKADSEKQHEWVENKLEPVIKASQNGELHLLFMDAAHFILQPFICALWCITRLFIRASAGRNRINVLGVVHAITKEVITLHNTSFISADTIVAFLKQIKEHFYDLPIVIVLDNARYQHCQLVQKIAEELGIKLLFLPPYSPNLNIIERLWKFTKKTILYARYYDSVDKFHTAVTGFFQNINQKYNAELKDLLTLKFQFFDNQNALIYAV